MLKALGCHRVFLKAKISAYLHEVCRAVCSEPASCIPIHMFQPQPVLGQPGAPSCHRSPALIPLKSERIFPLP